MKAHYTIKEFAIICGISKSAVYKKLNTTLSDYIVIIKGKKCISNQYFIDNPEDKKQEFNENSTFFNGESTYFNVNSTEFNGNSTENSTEFNENSTVNSTEFNPEDNKNILISIFQEQLNQKDKQIEILQKEITEQRESYTKLLEQAQILQLQAQQAQKLLLESSEKKKTNFFLRIFKRQKNNIPNE